MKISRSGDVGGISGLIWIPGADTLIISFLLGVETGRSFPALGFETALMGVTMLMIIVLPYFLVQESRRPQLAHWLAFRSFVAMLGVATGAILQSSPANSIDLLRSMPMTLLLLAALISFVLQFYGLMRLRLAK
jgi:hypothetical protein